MHIKTGIVQIYKIHVDYFNKNKKQNYTNQNLLQVIYSGQNILLY